MRARQKILIYVEEFINFNTLAHAGETRCLYNIYCKYKNFNTLAHAGETYNIRFKLKKSKFQYTRPCGRDRIKKTKTRIRENFNTLAHAGETQIETMFLDLFNFNTLAHAGETDYEEYLIL